MIGRNDLCWCDSGKKYKKCHFAADKASGNIPKNPLVKTEKQIEGMRKAGAFNGELMEYIRQFVKPGVTTESINEKIHKYTLDAGHTPATLNYHGYPKSCCISRNNVVCHGIPSEEEKLEDGDIVNIDLTTIVDGYFGDQSETFILGEVPAETKLLVQKTAEATEAAIKAIKPGVPLSIVGDCVEPIIKKAGFSVVRSYTGHGIGTQFHENITVLHHKNKENRQVMLEAGMTFTIEPMINQGTFGVFTDQEDGWTVYTRDNQLSAQFEHTLLVTETGVEILTLTPSQRKSGEIITINEVK